MIKLRRYEYVAIVIAAAYILVNIQFLFLYPVEYALYWCVLFSLIISICILGSKCITVYIIGMFEYIMGIFQPIDSLVHSDIYSDTMRITEGVLLDKNYRIIYMAILILSYAVMYCVVGLTMADGKKRIKIKLPDSFSSYRELLRLRILGNPLTPLFICMIFSCFRYGFQIKYSILVHSSEATIPNVAFWVYFLRMLSLFMWTVGIEFYLQSGFSIRKMTLCSLALIVVCSFPEILIGNRSSIILYLAQVIVAFLLYKKEEINGIVRKVIGYGIALGVIGAFSIVVSNYFRTGGYVPLFNFLRYRITGLVDGLVVINYLQTGGQKQRFIDFVLATIGNNGTAPLASFYTHDIIGYPTGTNHAYAIPGFICGALYAGVKGAVFGSAFLSRIMAFCEKKSRVYLLGVGQKKNDSKVVILYSYVYAYIVFQLLLEGNIDKTFPFVLPALGAYIMFKMLNINLKSKEV